MSVFEGAAICADYFGDEFGVPLPLPLPLPKEVATKAMDHQSNPATTQPRATKKNSLERKQHVAPALLAFSPALDGLHCFETFFSL